MKTTSTFAATTCSRVTSEPGSCAARRENFVRRGRTARIAGCPRPARLERDPVADDRAARRATRSSRRARPGSARAISPSSVSTSYAPRCCTATRPGTSPARAMLGEVRAPVVVPAERREVRRARLPPDGALERALDAQAAELEARVEEPRGQHALALEEHGLAHLAEHRPDRDCREPGRPWAGRALPPSARTNWAFVAGLGELRLTGPATIVLEHEAVRRDRRRPARPRTTTACRSRPDPRRRA